MTNNPEIRVFSTAGTEADNDKLWKKTVDDTLLTKANVDLANLSTIGQAKFNSKASVSLDNLNTSGEARFTNKASIDLDNLSPAGEAKIAGATGGANTDLSNLSATGEARFTVKADKTYVDAQDALKLNLSLDNINATGQAVIDGKANVDLMNTNFITNAILSAPNGVATYSGLQLQLPAGTVLACPDGKNADGTRKSIVVTTASLLTLATTAVNGSPFKLFYIQSSNTIDRRRTDITYYYEQPTTPTGMSSGALWYNNAPSVNKCYQYNGSTWDEYPFVVIADFSYTGGAISNFNARYPVELLKRSDSEFIACLSSPSSTLKSYMVGASGTSYIAGYSGYFVATGITSATSITMVLANVTANGLGFSTPANTLTGKQIKCYVSCCVGDSINLVYEGITITSLANIKNKGAV